MTNFSIREAEILCMKAARGAGYAWGLAEEAGFAAGWLAEHGFSHLEGIAHLFENIQRDPYGKPSLNHLDGVWASECGGLLCPIATGALLSDYSRHFADGSGSLAMVNVGRPALLLPFVNNASRITQTSLAVVWGSCKVIIGNDRAQITQGQDALHAEFADRVTVSATTGKPTSCFASESRVTLSNQILHSLMSFAAKTYIPETEELMKAGAGGEKVDDDG